MHISSERGDMPGTSYPAHAAPMRLHGHWLMLARLVWMTVALLAFVVFVFSIPAFFSLLRSACTGTAAFCLLVYNFTNQLSPENVRALASMHVSLDTYAFAILILDLASSLVFLAVGVLIFWRRSDEGLALFVSLVLIIYGVLGPNSNERSSALQLVYTAASPVVHLQNFLQDIFYPALGLFFFLFPSGRFVPRWSWIFVFAWVIQLVTYVAPTDSPFFTGNLPPFASLATWLFTYGTALGCQVYRYTHSSSPAQRQQTKWLVFGFASSFLLASVARGVAVVGFPGEVSRPDVTFILVKTTIGYVVLLPIPLAIGIAILRYRLWDIDTVINKALVYGSLTVLLGALYVGLIIGTASLASAFTSGQSAQNPLALAISTLAIAALFRPLRARIQRVIDRRFFRAKYDAAQTLARFAATLRQDVDLAELREHLVGVVDEAMRPAHVSLWLRPSEREAPH